MEYRDSYYNIADMMYRIWLISMRSFEKFEVGKVYNSQKEHRIHVHYCYTGFDANDMKPVPSGNATYYRKNSLSISS